MALEPGVDRKQKNDFTLTKSRSPNAPAASRCASRTNVLERYDSRAEQFHTGAAVHLPAQRLEPIDVAFDGPVAPGSVTAPSTAARSCRSLRYELLQRPDLRVVRLRHPAVERRHLAVSQDGAEAQDEASHDGEAGTLGLQHVDRGRLAGVQQGPLVD